MLPKKKTYYYNSNLQPNIPLSPISNFYNNYNLDSYTNHTVENIYNLLNFAESNYKMDNNIVIDEAVKKEEIKNELNKELKNTHFNGLFNDYKHTSTPIYYQYEKDKKILINEKIKNCIFCSTSIFSNDNINIFDNSPNCMFCNNIINSNNECESNIEEINKIEYIQSKREYNLSDLDKIEKNLLEINKLLDEIKSTNIEKNLKIKETFLKKSITINIDKINNKLKKIL